MSNNKNNEEITDENIVEKIKIYLTDKITQYNISEDFIARLFNIFYKIKYDESVEFNKNNSTFYIVSNKETDKDVFGMHIKNIAA